MAETPIITCPECKKKFKGKSDLEGKKIKCPFCAKPFTVPGKGQKVTAGAAAPASTAPEKATTWNEEENQDPYAVTNLDIRARCPNCANLMESEEAIICLFCGYNTLTRQWGKTEKVIGITFGEHLVHLLPGLGMLTGIVLLIIGLLFMCLALPNMVVKTWASFLDSEAMRLWIASLVLMICWVMGMWTFKRLVLNPMPEEEKKE